MPLTYRRSNQKDELHNVISAVLELAFDDPAWGPVDSNDPLLQVESLLQEYDRRSLEEMRSDFRAVPLDQLTEGSLAERIQTLPYEIYVDPYRHGTTWREMLLHAREWIDQRLTEDF